MAAGGDQDVAIAQGPTVALAKVLGDRLNLRCNPRYLRPVSRPSFWASLKRVLVQNRNTWTKWTKRPSSDSAESIDIATFQITVQNMTYCFNAEGQAETLMKSLSHEIRRYTHKKGLPSHGGRPLYICVRPACLNLFFPGC